MSNILHLPADASDQAIAYLRWISANKHRAIALGFPELSGYLADVMPGHIAMIQGQTHMGKTLVLNHIARFNLDRMAKEKQTDGKRVIPYISIEENLQEMTLKELSWRYNLPMEKLSRADVDLDDVAVKAGKLVREFPLVRIAADMMDGSSPPMPLSVIHKSLQELTGMGKEIVAIIVDYLHALPLDPDNKRMRSLGSDGQRKMQVRDDVYRLREMGNEFRCPIFVGGQCKAVLEHSPGRGISIAD